MSSSWILSLFQSAGRLLPRRLHNALAALLLFEPFRSLLRLLNFFNLAGAPSDRTKVNDKDNSNHNLKNPSPNNDTQPDHDIDILALDPMEDAAAPVNPLSAAGKRRARKNQNKRAAKLKKQQLEQIAAGNMEATENGTADEPKAFSDITNRIERITLAQVPGIVEAPPYPAPIWGDENATPGAEAPGAAEEPLDPVKEAQKAEHRAFMNEALAMARLALKTNETPVGCILVHNGRIVAKGMNATNVTRNGSRHAELMALTALLSYSSPEDTKGKGKEHTEEEWGDVDPKDGHIYPYGQKLHPAPRLTRDMIKDCILYVTVEPCVMCASLLRQLEIKKVYFGAINDKFGGTGGVFRVNKNSSPVPSRGPTYRVKPRDQIKPKLPVKGQYDEQKLNSTIIIPEGTIPDLGKEGDGGNVEHGYPVEGGWGRDEAVNLLRQFYVQENGRAPVPRKKEGRAARLAAMMEKAGQSTEGMIIPVPSTCGENDAGFAYDSTASGSSTPSLPATPMLAATTGAAPSIEATMAAETAPTATNEPATGAALATKPATKPTTKPVLPVLPVLPLLNTANKPAANTAKPGAPKT